MSSANETNDAAVSPPVDSAWRLTGPGASAIAVVRLRGPGVRRFLANHFTAQLAINRPVHGRLVDGERVIDDPLVVLLHDDLADVSLHGGAWVIRAFFDLASAAGFAVRDRLTLPLAMETTDGTCAVDQWIESYLPLAKTPLALRRLLAERNGNGETLRAVAMAAEARRLGVAIDPPALFWLMYPPSVAIVGIANAGKSTLANRLIGRERIITADEAGTTRDWVGELASLADLAVVLIDTPGSRAGADPLECEALRNSQPVIASADAVVLVLDPTQPRDPMQSGLIAAYPRAIKVINKCDRGDWPTESALRTVANTGQGVDELERQIAARFGIA